MTVFNQFDNADYGQHDDARLVTDGPHEDAADRAIPEQSVMPLRSPVQPFALPSQPTPLIGRDELVARLANYRDTPDIRLLTLIGPGGVGKTRLACELARRREREHELVHFIDLAQIPNSASFAALVQDALGPAQMPSRPLAEPI